MTEGEKNPLRKKRIKSLKKKIWKERLIKKKILLLFKLGKDLDSEYIFEGNKNIKIQVWQIYKSFEKIYSWMLYNKNWKLRHFRDMSIKNTEEITHNWISLELNSIKRENIWKS